MRRAVLLALAGLSIMAQEPSKSVAELPPAMKRAIDRLKMGHPDGPQTGRAFTLTQPNASLQATRTCVVPLIEYRPPNPEAFPIRTVAPEINDPMVRVPLPQVCPQP